MRNEWEIEHGAVTAPDGVDFGDDMPPLPDEDEAGADEESAS